MTNATRADYASAAGSARHADRASVATTAQEATTAGTADRALFTRGILSNQLSTLLGREDGDTVLTMGQDAPSDGLGKQYRWDATSVLAEVVGSVYGTGAQGRWIQAGTVTSSGGGSSGTSVTFTNPANGQLTAGSITSAVLLVVDGSVGGDVTTTGFLAPSVGGQLVKELRNNRSTNWVIKNQDSGATAANRVITPDGVDFVIGPGESATIAYDTAAARYVVSSVIAKRASSADKASGLDQLTTEQLFALPAINGRTVVTVGRFAVGDGGGGEFIGDASSTATADGGRIGGTVGRWISPRPKDVIFAAEYLGALDDTNKDARLALLWAACVQGSTTVIFPGGNLRTATGIAFPPGVVLEGNLSRADLTSIGQGAGQKPTIFWYDGTSTTTPLLSMSQYQQVRNICLAARPGRTMKCAVRLGAVSGYNASAPGLEGCVMLGYGSLGNTTFCGTMTDGVIVADGEAPNAEYLLMRDCKILNAENRNLWVAGGQPYDTCVEDVTFANLDRAAIGGFAHWGKAIEFARGSGSLSAYRCKFSRVEELLRASGDFAFAKIEDSDCEYVKKLVVSPGGFFQSRSEIVIHGRFDMHNYLASPNYAADDHYVVDTTFGQSIALHGSTSSQQTKTRARIRVTEHSRVEITGFWSDTCNPVRRVRSIGGTRSGGTFLRYMGSAPEPYNTGSLSGLILRPVVQTSGCENPDGSRLVSGAMTVVRVGFAPEEVAPPAITITASVASGTPAAGTWSIASVSTKEAVFVRSAPCGTGNAERLNYQLALPETDLTPGGAVETAFSADTVMAGPVGAGPIGSASGFWVVALVSEYGTNDGNVHMICGFANASGGWGIFRNNNGSLVGSANNVNAPVAGEAFVVTTPPMQTKIAVLVYTGTQIKFYTDGVLRGTTTGAFVPQASARFQVGVNPVYGWQNTNSALHSISYGTGVPTDAQVVEATNLTRDVGAARPPSGAGLVEGFRMAFDGDGAALDTVGTAHVTLVSGTPPVPMSIRPAWQV